MKLGASFVVNNSMRLHGGRTTTRSAFSLEVPPKMDWAPLVDVVVKARTTREKAIGGITIGGASGM